MLDNDLQITQLLRGHGGGFDELIRLAYNELKKVAGQERRRVFSGRPVTRQTTDIVHEVWDKLRKSAENCADGDHFFGVARIIIRQFLISYARERMALKRGGGLRGVELDSANRANARDSAERLPIEYAELLEKFGGTDPRASEIFALCALGGFTQPEVAELLDVGLATVERDLKYARAWWAKELADESDSAPAK